MLRAMAGPTASVTNAPAFSVYLNGAQAVASSTGTKVNLNIVEYNFGGSLVNGAWTPSVAGYYTVMSSGRAGGSGVTQMWFMVRKNGSDFARLIGDNTGGVTHSGACGIYLNGTTDFIELAGFVTATSGAIFETIDTSGLYGPRMSAFLSRAA